MKSTIPHNQIHTQRLMGKLNSYRVKDLDKWLMVTIPGLSLFYVLFVYQGYGIEQNLSLSGHDLFTRAFGFGLLTSAVFFVFEFLVSPLFNTSAVKKEVILYALTILAGLNATFLLFNYFWQWSELTWDAYRLFLFEYPLVVLIPVLAISAYRHATKKDEVVTDFQISISSTNKKDTIVLDISDLLYVKAAGNYVEVYYMNGNAIYKHLLRTTLSEVEKHINKMTPILVRSHRSYLVNKKIKSTIIKDNSKVLIDIGYAQLPITDTYRHLWLS